MAKLRAVGVGFDHMHIGDQLQKAVEHAEVELVGVFEQESHRERAINTLRELGIDVPIYTDLETLAKDLSPDIALVCTTTNAHDRVVETMAPYGVSFIIEKPMSSSNESARKMIAIAEKHHVALVVNWPLAWYPVHRTTNRLVQEGAIGHIVQVHFYDGNRGPLYHAHNKIPQDASHEEKASSWWYNPALGGGSLRDYLGYGTTLGTWFRGGELPLAVTGVWHIPDGLQVDEQSAVIGHYRDGLSVFQTRWGTFTDPWTRQPLPHCGFVVNGTEGSIASWDFETHVTLHDANEVRNLPIDALAPEESSALANLVAHLVHGRPIDNPISAETSRRGQLIVEAAVESARTGRTVPVIDTP